MNDRLLEQIEIKKQLEQQLAEWHELENHPRRAKLFELAWEYGHAHGEGEVEMFYTELAGLLQ